MLREYWMYFYELLQQFVAGGELHQLSAIIFVVLVVTWIMRALKQPIMIGYILAWILVSPFALNLVHEEWMLESFAHIWVWFLLFMVWLWLNPKVIKELGKTSLITWWLQIFITAWLGYWLSLLLGFDYITALYVWIWLTFSSTIVILKLLSDKKETQQLHAKLSIGVLIVQDLVVMLFLMGMTMINNVGEFRRSTIGLLWLKVVIISLVLLVITRYVFPWLLKRVAQSQENLLLFGIGWSLILGSIFYYMGFSMEIGTLLAWMTLAASPYRFEMSSRMRPLRDFFIVMFFVFLWSHMEFGNILSYIPAIIVLSLFVVIMKPTIIFLILSLLWYTKKNASMSAISLGQISEFSFILMGMAVAYGYVQDATLVTVMTLIWLVTITLSSYGILYSHGLYKKLEKTLWYFESKRKSTMQPHVSSEWESVEAVVLWYSKIAYKLVDSLKALKTDYLVVDHDPEVIRWLHKRKVPAMFGDASNKEFLNEINFAESEIVVATMDDFATNMLIIQTVKAENKDALMICVGRTIDEAIEYYEYGADYVIMPNFLGSNHASSLIREKWFDVGNYIDHKRKHLHDLHGMVVV